MRADRAPRCFGGDKQARRWVGATRHAAPGPSAFCADCTRAFQSEMLKAGLCDHPDTFFVVEPDGTEVGVKPKDPRQVRLFDAA